MEYKEIQNLYSYLFEGNNKGQDKNCPPIYKEIKEKFQITKSDEKISVSKAIHFINEVFEINFVYPDRLMRYARKFGLIVEEEKPQRNWKIHFTYDDIFRLMFMPLYLFLKEKERL